ncbi:hypothetical protein [Occultella kanbiaonis]|uniref:hypothetical protein n=1 Tax=Occultella kanbiaonis TaxID=2675754 RepID=UPI0013D290B8|nr:hypothetical protein [Occultella kanbiaonis]
MASLDDAVATQIAKIDARSGPTIAPPTSHPRTGWRLRPACATARVLLTDVEQVDSQVRSWLRAAYESA